MNKKPLPIGILLLFILLFSIFSVASVVSFVYAVIFAIENDPSLVKALISGAVTGVLAAVLMVILLRDRSKHKDAREEAMLSGHRKGTNYIEKYSRIYTKNYTNERIRTQIEENSAFFRTLIFMVLVGLAMTIYGIGISEHGLYQRNVPCLVFGIVIIIVNTVGILTFGSLNMFKHIRPHCSGKRYKAKEINDLANHPDTVWNEGLEIYLTPEALIGINRGLTVIEYDDIVSIKAKKKYHTRRIGPPYPTTAGRLFTSFAYEATKDFKDWYTYLIIIKTRTHKRMVLTEVGDSNCDKALKELLDKRTSQ